MSPQDFSDSANLQEINNYTNLTVKAFTVDLPLRYRTGQPLYIQNWGDGAGHAIAFKSGLNAASTIQANKFLTKRSAWLLKAGSTVGWQAKLYLRLGPYENAKISFEWAMTWDPLIDHWYFSVVWPYGADYYYAELYIDVDADEIQIFNDVGARVSIRTPINLYAHVDAYHFFKLTLDFTTGMYVEAFIDEDRLDLTSHTMLSDPISAGEPISMDFAIYGGAGDNPFVYVDDIAMILENA